MKEKEIKKIKKIKRYIKSNKEQIIKDYLNNGGLNTYFEIVNGNVQHDCCTQRFIKNCVVIPAPTEVEKELLIDNYSTEQIIENIIHIIEQLEQEYI